MLDKLNITEILVAFLTGGTAVAIVKAIPALFTSRKSKSEVALTDIAWIYKTLSEMRHILKAQDCWIGRSSNGGGIPRVGHTVYHSFEYHVTDSTALPGPTDKIAVDAGLATFLARAAASRVTIQNTQLFTGDMHELFEGRKVVCVVAFHILTTDKHFFYAGFGFSANPKMHVNKQAEILRIVAQIKKRLVSARS